MSDDEVLRRLKRVILALVDGKCQDFAAMFAEGGAHTYLTRGRELDGPALGRGMDQIAKAAHTWLGLTARRRLLDQSISVLPDALDPSSEGLGAFRVAHVVLANFTFEAVLANCPDVRVVVRVQNVVHLTQMLLLAFVQSDQTIVVRKR